MTADIEALGKLYYRAAPYANLPWDLAEAVKAVPTAPEEPIQMEGWEAQVRCGSSGGIWWCAWYTARGSKITTHGYGTEAEAIAAGNAMLREIAQKVKL